MGRKIPAKKHRGVKDPTKQQAKRMLSLKTKINAPPKDPDEQPVPRSLTQLFALKKKLENRHKGAKKKKNKNLKTPEEDSNTVNPVAKLRRVSGESARAFTLRINSAIRTLNNSQHEHDYPVEDIEEEDVKGDKMAQHRMRREKKRKNTASRNKGEAEEEEPPRIGRGKKLTIKKKDKKIKAAEKSTESEVMYEQVAFGDVAHAPPTLTSKPRQAQTEDGAPRPGKRDLLLNNLLTSDNNNDSQTENKKTNEVKKDNNNIKNDSNDKKINGIEKTETIPKVEENNRSQFNIRNFKNDYNSRKSSKMMKKPKEIDLAPIEHMRRERARLDAVNAYRLFKQNKMHSI